MRLPAFGANKDETVAIYKHNINPLRMKLKKLYCMCRQSNASFIYVVLYWIYAKLRKKEILMHHKTILRGLGNIKTKGRLWIGIDDIGFTHAKDHAFLNVRGGLETQGSIIVGKGCRFDIGKNAVVEIGGGTAIRPFTNIIVQHGLQIGERCSISWHCQFLDEDFHEVNYEGKKRIAANRIVIGDEVWIGNHVSIYKGSLIGRRSVVASNSVVKGRFEEENVIIAGNPAKIIKRNISWEIEE
jgi:acetyltransferase-like isoleucine patch superfamily enzyme